jgi:hypothetical protein
VVVDSHYFDEEQDPDSYQDQSKKADPSPHHSEKSDPERLQSTAKSRIRVRTNVMQIRNSDKTGTWFECVMQAGEGREV